MTIHSASNDTKGRRVSVDLSPAAAGEVDRLRSITTLSTADLFRFALSLLRIYVEARRSGQHLCIAGLNDERPTRIELPFPVPVESVGQPAAPALQREPHK